MSLLSYDHKVALFDRLAPHFAVISCALGRRVEDLGDGSQEGFSAMVARNAVDGAVSAMSPVEPTSSSPPGFRSRTWWDGRVVATWRDAPGRFATLSLTLGPLCVVAGVEHEPHASPRIACSPEIGVHDGALRVDLELVVGLLCAWFHVSLGDA